jgi:hypothetical protein
MASFAQTVANSLNVLGVSPPSLWGVMVWGTDNWGVTEDVATSYEKGLSETITLTDALGKSYDLTPIADTITLTESPLEINRSIGIWDYNFTKPTIDGSEAVYDESSKISDPSTTWTKQSDGSTTWS